MSALFSWFHSVVQSWLTYLGLVGKEGTILLLGLDNAGKTTLLHRLRTGCVLQFPPTERPTRESFQAEGVNFVGWDLGGHEAVRHLWDDYVTEGNAFVFIIDASDRDRLEESAEELEALIGEGSVENAPVAILLNKCDLETALSSQTVASALGFEELRSQHGEAKIAMFRISVLRGEGYQDAFKWLASFL